MQSLPLFWIPEGLHEILRLQYAKNAFVTFIEKVVRD